MARIRNKELERQEEEARHPKRKARQRYRHQEGREKRRTHRPG